MGSHRRKWGNIQEPSKCIHKSLKLVEFVGNFDIDLAMYFIQNAITLQKIIVDCRQAFIPEREEFYKDDEWTEKSRNHALELKRMLPLGVDPKEDGVSRDLNRMDQGMCQHGKVFSLTEASIGWLIPPNRGLRQGNPLSPYKLLIAVNVFSTLITLINKAISHTMDLNLNELRSPDPGPRDGSILRLQQKHRSRAIWEADVSDISIIVRSAKKAIRALPWPSPPILEFIRRARLEGLCSLPFVSVDWGLITALLERWRPETHTFHLWPGESTITLQDVEILLGIPVEGKPVTGNTNLKPRDLCKHLLGEQPTEESDINGMKVKTSWLSDRGETIFVDHSGGYVHLANLERLENFDEAGTYSWGSGALANLYHNLCHGCKASTKQITGCFILLQVWAWERLPYLAPG
ncbi:hypothetical protein RHSIM_Rhsim10G0000300 [Rhododendron simsii]|uniref:Aminotransferase-like plant mobile domain-containing protein n=1 Tax=Rhododendron simsii TaxID=118357 RepID=A0A834GA60_RHOSS|nr:hypothetical protein RHSIM_Rhsim10G0000300 [Rhododendron simsii]